jgi:hypothetical protein
LRRFTLGLSSGLSLLLLAVAASPLARVWFDVVAGLPPSLIGLAQIALLLGFLLPALRVLQSGFQGAITYSRHTRGIGEAVVMSMLTSGAVLVTGVLWGGLTGVYVGVLALTAGFAAQALWLGYRARPALHAVEARDAASPSPAAALTN